MGTVVIELEPMAASFLGTEFPQLKHILGTNGPVDVLAFDDGAASTAEAAFWDFVAQSYGSGNLTVDILWYADTASSGNVRWGAAIKAITPDTDTQDVETDAFATASLVTDSHLGTTGQRLHKATITVSNLDSIAAGDHVQLKIYRDADDGTNDTMSGDAHFQKGLVSYSDT